MISTAAYYCDRGHVWETTASTRGHDEERLRPCLQCMLAADEHRVSVTGTTFGPFPDRQTAKTVMLMRAYSATQQDVDAVLREHGEAGKDYLVEQMQIAESPEEPVLCNSCRREDLRYNERHWCQRAVQETTICQCPGRHYR